MNIHRTAHLRSILHKRKLSKWQGFAMTPLSPATIGLPITIWFGHYTLLNRKTIAIHNGSRWIDGAVWMAISNRPKLQSTHSKRIRMPMHALLLIRQWVIRHRTALLDDWHYKTDTFESLIALGLWSRKDHLGIEMLPPNS